MNVGDSTVEEEEKKTFEQIASRGNATEQKKWKVNIIVNSINVKHESSEFFSWKFTTIEHVKHTFDHLNVNCLVFVGMRLESDVIKLNLIIKIIHRATCSTFITLNILYFSSSLMYMRKLVTVKETRANKPEKKSFYLKQTRAYNFFSSYQIK